MTNLTPHPQPRAQGNDRQIRLDLDRLQRQGFPETVFCPGKTTEQLREIFRTMTQARQNVMATRATPDLHAELVRFFPEAVYHTDAHLITLDVVPLPEPRGQISIICAGTADVPVAEEARITAMRFGAKTHTIYDAGVAGLHRLTSAIDETASSNAVIVVAGMEGALPSVVGGLIDLPLIAVPTSVGYGWNLEGLSALLAMLNSCAAGVTVVNVDNGYGAGVAAARINRRVTTSTKSPAA
ncbi:MAG: nickel pincer cofactor biosynthesis protein LarB [Kiritimatiellae bacterium]|nr:nickel pincer cofactor biosynthesis protein LarB [Kiritimatiellia bacterium]